MSAAPASYDDLSMTLRAVVETADRCQELASLLDRCFTVLAAVSQKDHKTAATIQALASKLVAVGDEGQGTRFARDRVAAADAHRQPNEQIEQILATISRNRAASAFSRIPHDANDPDGKKRQARIDEIKASGRPFHIESDPRQHPSLPIRRPRP
jgi:hypothetical protein